MEKKKEEWNPSNLLTEEKINKTIDNFAHFTFKISNSNALSGGLIAEKVDLDGYVCMSSVMSGTEYELMNNPSAQAKIYKRINAVIEGTEDVLFNNVNKNDVIYIKKQLSNIKSEQSSNLNTSNKRLKQIIIQDKNEKNEIENKELIILRSSGFAKVLTGLLKKEQEIDDKTVYRRKKAQMSFGGSNPINIGVNGYLMSNVLYFEAPQKNGKETNFDEAYKIHHTGIKLYDLVNIEFLKKYYAYQEQIDNKLRINAYLVNKEKELIEELFYYIKTAVSKKYKLLEANKENFSNKNLFSDNILKIGNEDKLIALTVLNKNINKNSDEMFINCLLAILKTKTFILDKRPTNLILTDTNIFNIKKILKELLWQNI